MITQGWTGPLPLVINVRCTHFLNWLIFCRLDEKLWWARCDLHATSWQCGLDPDWHALQSGCGLFHSLFFPPSFWVDWRPVTMSGRMTWMLCLQQRNKTKDLLENLISTFSHLWYANFSCSAKCVKKVYNNRWIETYVLMFLSSNLDCSRKATWKARSFFVILNPDSDLDLQGNSKPNLFLWLTGCNHSAACLP